MSRSRRHVPICGNAMGSGSEASYKRCRAKRERAKTREALAHQEYDDVQWEQAKWDEWSTSRDGKQYLTSDVIERIVSRYHNDGTEGLWRGTPLWKIWGK